MKKILIVDDGFPPHKWGGASTVSYLHATGLQKRGYDVTVFTTTQSEGLEGWSDYAGLKVRTFYIKYHERWWAWLSLYNPRVAAEFKKELVVCAPHIVHFHTLHHYFSYHTIQIAKQSGAKVFMTAHDVMSFAYRKLRPGPYRVSWWQNLRDARWRFNPLRNFVIRYYLRQVDQIFAVSNALKEALAANGTTGNVSVVHNGVDVSRFTISPLSKEPAVLFVGRFTPDKGRDVLLRAFAKVVRTVPSAKLTIVGFAKDQREPEMEVLIDELGMRSHLQFVPPVPYEEMPEWYAKATVVVVPSIIFDCFPTANLEAMAAGRPVVATTFGGSREAVVEGETGYIVDPRDVELLAEKITTLLTDSALAERLGHAGRTRLVTTLTSDRQLNRYESFY